MVKRLTSFMKLYAVVALVFLTGSLAQAQITGNVTDVQTDETLIGATVLIKGTSTGTVTDIDGNFSIDANTGDVLVISYTGYNPREVTIGVETNYIVTLDRGLLIDEVIVTGYSTQSKRNVSGAIASVETEALKSLPAGSVESSLQGRVAGVQVSTSGVPGSETMVRIRGFGTINNNQPLYVIDGLPVQGGIIELNPHDIKSISVLKDASAASIYGSRASNGVIIITTKTGSVTGKSTLTLDVSVGSQWSTNFPDLVDQLTWANLEFWEKPTNLGQPTGNAMFGNGSSPVIPDFIWPVGASASQVNLDDYFYSTDLALWNGITRAAQGDGTDWFDEIFDNALVQNYNLSISGGNEAAQYAIGAGYLNQEGTRIHSGYERSNIRANSIFRINDRLRVGQNLTISYTREEGERPVSGAEQIIDMAARQPAHIPVFDISGVNFSSNKGIGSASSNPVQEAFINRHDLNTKIRALGSAYLEWEIIPNLNAKTSFSVDFANSDNRDISRAAPNYVEPRLGNGTSRSTNQVLNTTWYNTLSYSRTIADDHDIGVLVGTEAIENNFKFFSAGRIQFLLEELDFMVIDAGPTDGQSTTGGKSESTLFSVFGKIDYAFKGKYLLSATVRRDGSSRFGSNNRYATFPAFSAGWRISDEAFFNSGFINELKIRGGWGRTGNQEIDNLAQFTLFSTAEITTATYDISGTNNSIKTGIQGTNIGNPDLKWEETTDINVGIDAAFFNNRLNLSFDVYKRTTEDLLLPVPPSTLIGVVGNQFRNVGEIENKGFDLSLGYSSGGGRGFTYDISLVVSAYDNEVTALDESLDFINGDDFRSSFYTRTTTGYPISSFFGLEVEGIFQTQAEVDAHAEQNNKGVGRFKFTDVNGDGIIDADDRTFLGSPHPDFTLGWNTTLGWKGFDFNMFWQGNFGNEIAEVTRLFTDLQQFQGARNVRVLNSFGRPGVDNASATLPIYGTITADENGPNSYYIQDGTYFRLKNVALGYTLGNDIVGQLGMESLRIFVQANNVITITDYEGVDPEVQFISQGDLTLGLDGGFYPVPKSVLFGVTAKF